MEKKEYKPHLSQVVFLTLLGCALILFGAKYLDDYGLKICLIFGLTLYLYSFAVVLWLTNRERIAFYRSVTDLADCLKELDADQWQALGIAFPTMRIHWSGKPVQFIEDSDFTVDDFRRFMEDSDFRQISPERNWSNGRQRRAWLKIKTWLENRQYIQQYSASGNHSWLWRGNIYHTLKERYLGADPIRALDDPEIYTDSQMSEPVGI